MKMTDISTNWTLHIMINGSEEAKPWNCWSVWKISHNTKHIINDCEISEFELKIWKIIVKLGSIILCTLWYNVNMTFVTAQLDSLANVSNPLTPSSPPILTLLINKMYVKIVTSNVEQCF